MTDGAVFFRPLDRFPINCSTQHYVIKMLENLKHLLDDGYRIAAVFMDLSKAFDVLNRSSKLDAYEFSRKSTAFIQSYLNKRIQKVNINKFSRWKDILTGVP